MEKETKTVINDNGSYTKVTVKEYTPEDGPVSLRKEFPLSRDNRGKYVLGHFKKISVATNDPKITRPFVRIMCGIFFGIGILEVIIGLLSFRLSDLIFNLFLGISFIAAAVAAYRIANRDISRIEKELKQKQNNPNAAPQNGNIEE